MIKGYLGMHCVDYICIPYIDSEIIYALMKIR